MHVKVLKNISKVSSFTFNDKPVTVVEEKNNPYRWLIVEEVREILEYKWNQFSIVRRLSFRDEVIAYTNITPFNKLNLDNSLIYHLNEISMPRINNSIMLISELGLYEFLVRSSAHEAKDFQHWLYFDILPSLKRKG